MRTAFLGLWLAAAACGRSSEGGSNDRVTVISRGEAIDEASVVEKGKVTAILWTADW